MDPNRPMNITDMPTTRLSHSSLPMPGQSSSSSPQHLDLIVRVFEESRRIQEEERLAREEEARAREEERKTKELQLELMRTLQSLYNNSQRNGGLINMLQNASSSSTPMSHHRPATDPQMSYYSDQDPNSLNNLRHERQQHSYPPSIANDYSSSQHLYSDSMVPVQPQRSEPQHYRENPIDPLDSQPQRSAAEVLTGMMRSSHIYPPPEPSGFSHHRQSFPFVPENSNQCTRDPLERNRGFSPLPPPPPPTHSQLQRLPDPLTINDFNNNRFEQRFVDESSRLRDSNAPGSASISFSNPASRRIPSFNESNGNDSQTLSPMQGPSRRIISYNEGGTNEASLTLSHPILAKQPPIDQTSNEPSSSGPTVGTGAKGRKVVEDACYCRHCNKFLAQMILRGKDESLAHGYTFDVRCGVPCGEDNLDDETSRREGKAAANIRKRKRKREGDAIGCEVCRRKVANGEVTISVTEKRKKGEVEIPELVSVPYAQAGVTLEVICASCHAKYAFCTECGGGGKYRTGKFRPSEMFLPGRRTCTLSHVRIGDTALEHRVWDVDTRGTAPDTHIDASMITDIKSVYEDGVLSLYAIPKVMEEYERFSTYANLSLAVSTAWERCRTELNTPVSDTSLVSHITMSWMPKVPRKKNKRANNVLHPQNVDVHGAVPADHILYGFLLTRWDVPRGAIEVVQFSARMMAMQSVNVIRDMLRRVLQSNIERSEHERKPKPRLVYLHSRKDNTRVQAFFEKMGFVSEEEFDRRQQGDGGLRKVREIVGMRTEELAGMLVHARTVVAAQAGMDAANAGGGGAAAAAAAAAAGSSETVGRLEVDLSQVEELRNQMLVFVVSVEEFLVRCGDGSGGDEKDTKTVKRGKKTG
ncbi:hypothetical protein BJ742DRAFT_377451 [Cladochytrium replicatum]|nr:hypothetical protein BJ742DRAFT_377451 [Cladochytrium replicatum]